MNTHQFPWRALTVAFVLSSHCAVQAASEDLAQAVIRGVERREQLIGNIHSMKAVWRMDEFHLREGRREETRERDAFLLEGVKERIESVFWHNVPPGPVRPPTLKERVTGRGVRAFRLPSGTRKIIVSDGRNSWLFIPTETGPTRGPALFSGSGLIMPPIAAWAGFGWRFRSAEAPRASPSWLMRRGRATAERLPGPPLHYKIKVRSRSPGQTSTSVWSVAPEYGYAVIRHQTDYDERRPGRSVSEYKQFRELAPGVWLPHRSRVLMYRLDANGKWRLRSQQVAVAEEMKLNVDIPDRLFRLPKGK